MSAIIDALEDYMKAASQRLEDQLHDLPRRMWWRVTEHSGRRTGFHSGERLDYARLATRTEGELRGSAPFEAVARALLYDQSLAESALVAPARASARSPSLFPPSGIPDRVVKLASDLLIVFLTEYFGAADTYAFVEPTFREVAHQLANFTLAPGIVTHRLMPLTDMRILLDAFELAPGTVLRKVTSSDVERWLNHDRPEAMLVHRIAGHRLLTLDCAVDITYHHDTVNFFEADQEADELCNRVVTALRLALDGDIHPAFWEGQLSGSLSRIYSGEVRPMMRAISIPGPLDEQSGKLLKQTWNELHTSPMMKIADLAIRRWDNASERRRQDDRLVDYWIGLESLFAPDSNQEVRFRASHRIAAYLGATGDERLEIYDFMLKSYDCRSAIVHGDQGRRGLKQVPAYEQGTRRYLRAAILKILSTPSFTPKSIERDLLAGCEVGDNVARS